MRFQVQICSADGWFDKEEMAFGEFVPAFTGPLNLSSGQPDAEASTFGTEAEALLAAQLITFVAQMEHERKHADCKGSCKTLIMIRVEKIFGPGDEKPADAQPDAQPASQGLN